MSCLLASTQPVISRFLCQITWSFWGETRRSPALLGHSPTAAIAALPLSFLSLFLQFARLMVLWRLFHYLFIHHFSCFALFCASFSPPPYPPTPACLVDVCPAVAAVAAVAAASVESISTGREKPRFPTLPSFLQVCETIPAIADIPR